MLLGMPCSNPTSFVLRLGMYKVILYGKECIDELYGLVVNLRFGFVILLTAPVFSSSNE